MKKAWERTAKIREALLAHRLRLEQAKASVQVVPSSIEHLASLVLTFECSGAPDEQLKCAEQRLDELFEYLSDTRRTAEELVDQVNSLIEDAELVHDRVEDVMAAEPLESPVVIQ
jgi:hypothetical protein